jgi:hypothetical protein
MMRSIGRLGDRLLNTLVPQTTAAACVPPTAWEESSDLADCYCRWCHDDCSGKTICGAWQHCSYC